MRKIIYLFTLSFFLFIACQPEQDQKKLDNFSRGQLQLWNRSLTKVIVTDIFTPPVASRIYAYANIAAYEALRPGNADYLTLAGQLNELKVVPQPLAEKEYYFPLSSIVAFAEVSKKLVFDKTQVEQLENKYLADIRELGINNEIYENSVAYGQQVAAAIVAWAGKDGYLERQALSRYVLTKEPGKWQPTPPDYMAAIEPNWHTVRPFVMQTASQFKPVPPTPFDTLPGSPFYNEVMEVYEVVKNKNEQHLEIAKFWDCNPNISYTQGHLMFYHQKISPGGHWISIASIASLAKAMDMMQTSESLALVSIALADGFISCWDEKYRSSLIRPETYIERYIDPEWDPLLQTPAFPEYPSGHSVISTAAATVLTKLHGTTFAFTDSSEVDYGLPVRNFSSFYEASEEAALSRLYGGIHFRPAIVNGVSQGKNVGEYVMDRIKTRAQGLAVKQ